MTSLYTQSVCRPPSTKRCNTLVGPFNFSRNNNYVLSVASRVSLDNYSGLNSGIVG
jgi:hypothetical protein